MTSLLGLRLKTPSSSRAKELASLGSAVFQKLGLDADKDIAIMQVGQARFASMEKGAIEATVLSSAESAYAKRMGFRVLDMPALPFFGSTVVTTPALATKKSDAFIRYMKGYLDGVRFFLN